MHTVAIFGVPRSGTSWLGQLFNSSPYVAYRFQPLFSYAFKDRISENSSAEEIEQFYRDLLDARDDFVLQNKSISGGKTPDFSKRKITHLVFKHVRYLHLVNHLLEKTDTKIIGLVRHPCAVLHSWFHAPKEFKKEWDPLEEWKTAPSKNRGDKNEFYGYERWKESTLKFIQYGNEYGGRFRLLLYEQLNEDPVTQVKNLFHFTGLPFESQTLDFINESTNRESTDPYGVYRENKGSYDWVGRLEDSITEEILNDKAFQRIDSILGWKWDNQGTR